MMDGTVNINPPGDYVANQLWPTPVQELISYSSDLMKELFTTLGVQADDITPFCRDFISLEDLQDEFSRYMPATFNYDHVQGTYDEEVEEMDDDGNDDPPNEVSVADRVVRFAREITELAEQTEGSSGGSDKEGFTSEGTDSAIDEEGDRVPPLQS